MATGLAREEFSKRLRKSLEEKGFSLSSPTQLAKDFSEIYPSLRVSQQGFRKWLHGETIPSRERIRALAEWLAVFPNWLQYGELEGAGHKTQAAAPSRNPLPDRELVKRYRRLSLSQQQTVAEIITALAAKDRRR